VDLVGAVRGIVASFPFRDLEKRLGELERTVTRLRGEVLKSLGLSRGTTSAPRKATTRKTSTARRSATARADGATKTATRRRVKTARTPAVRRRSATPKPATSETPRRRVSRRKTTTAPQPPAAAEILVTDSAPSEGSVLPGGSV
jgi:hypothetical protein